MKHVYGTNASLIHAFAQNNSERSKCGNLFFEGKKLYLYGYHYLLAEFIKDKEGKDCILINDKGYSVSIRKHIGIVTQATRQYKQYFAKSIDDALVLRRLQTLNAKLPNAIKTDMYISEIIGRVETYKKQRYELGLYINPEIVSFSDKITPEQIEKAKIKALEAKKKEEAKIKANIAAFLNYESNRINGSKEDYIRLSLDKTQIETNQEVKIPIEEAKSLYKAIVNNLNVIGYQIGSYYINDLTNKHLIVGCHKIVLSNLHEVGNKLLSL